MAKKRRHHILPRFYLEGFLSPLRKTMLYQYEKGNPKIVRTTIENAAVIKDYYSIEDPVIEEDKNIVEDALSYIESFSAPVIQKINNRENLSDEDQAKFSIFLAYMFTRVPHHRQMTEDLYTKGMKAMMMTQASHKEGFKQSIKKLEEETGDKIDYPIEKLRAFLGDETKYEIRAHPNVSLDFIKFGDKLAPIFLDMKWSFWEATGESKFLTSDNPFYYLDRSAPAGLGIGLINKNIEVYFPVSQDLMFCACWHDVKGYRKLDSTNVRGWNRNTIVFASRFVYSPQRSEGINKIVQKHVDSAPRIETTWAGKKYSPS